MTHTSDTPWWQSYCDFIEPAYQSLIAAEQHATHISCFNFTSVNGLLQTDDYSHIISKSSRLAPTPQSIQERAAVLRIERQWHVLERASPPTIHALIDETALYRSIGNPQILREQVMHLATLNQLPHIIIRVLPLSHPINYAAEYGLFNFTLLRSSSEHLFDSVYLEQYSYTQQFSLAAAIVNQYRMLFEYLWDKALSNKQSAQLIEDAADKFDCAK